MIEPRRLLDETDNPLERVLLGAGASYRSDPELRVKTMAVLGLAGSAALVTTSTAASLAPAAKIGWVKLLGAFSALGAATSIPVGYYAWQHTRASEPAPAAAVVSAPRPMLARKAAGRVAESTDQAPAVAARPSGEPSSTGAQTAAGQAESKSTRSIDLTAELGVLDAARSALAGGDPRQALTLLDTYARAYPRGRLELEAEVLRIDALAKSGEMDETKKRAQVFVRRHPKSILASRVRGYLDE